METITSRQEIKVGDYAILTGDNREGRILAATIYGFMVKIMSGIDEYHDKVRPSEIIAVHRRNSIYFAILKD